MLVFIPIMPESLPISIIYDGPDVDNGSMPIDEVVDALQGFSSAYGRIASLVDSERTHQIRVSSIKEGSFHVDLVVLWAILVAQEGHIKTMETVAGAAKYVYDLLVGVIRAKKHVKSEPYNISVKGNDNTLLLINAQGAELQIPVSVLEILQSKLIDGDLKKIVSPLRENSIDKVELKAGDEEEETIDAKDREYFRTTSTSTSKETELEGTLVSLNKETNRGTFRLGNVGVPYHYVGNNAISFYSDFSYRGPVRITCIAHFDEALRPTLLEVSKAIRLQSELPLSSSETISPIDQT